MTVRAGVGKAVSFDISPLLWYTKVSPIGEMSSRPFGERGLKLCDNGVWANTALRVEGAKSRSTLRKVLLLFRVS